MAGITRVNGFGQYTTGTVRQTANLGFYKATVRSTSDGVSNTAVDLQPLDDGASPELVELIVQGTNAIAHFTPTAGNGEIALVVDNQGHTADSIAAIIEGLSGVGTDTIVEAADQLTFK